MSLVESMVIEVEAAPTVMFSVPVPIAAVLDPVKACEVSVAAVARF